MDSWGWTLLLLLLVASIAYVGGGAGYNHKVKGLRGAELFPNQQFWRELRGLVADGAAVTHSRIFSGQQQEDAGAVAHRSPPKEVERRRERCD